MKTLLFGMLIILIAQSQVLAISSPIKIEPKNEEIKEMINFNQDRSCNSHDYRILTDISKLKGALDLVNLNREYSLEEIRTLLAFISNYKSYDEVSTITKTAEFSIVEFKDETKCSIDTKKSKLSLESEVGENYKTKKKILNISCESKDSKEINVVLTRNLFVLPNEFVNNSACADSNDFPLTVRYNFTLQNITSI